MNNITLHLQGRIPSKKNNLRRVMRGRKVFTVSSPEYFAWENYAVMALKQQSRDLPLSMFPIKLCEVEVLITFPDLIRADLSNKLEGIMDAMVKAYLIADDSWQVVRSITARSAGKDKDKAGAVIRIMPVVEGV